MKETKQIKIWKQKFGKDYTLRNPKDTTVADKLYVQNYGISRTKMNREFIGGLDRSLRILEVGSNVGVQLIFLQKMGFKNLYGIEINKEAIELFRSKTKNINVIYGTAFDIPFKDNYFDLVFTAGVLIHISPLNIEEAMREIYRCSKKYIWGFEYYADNYTEIPYRGKKNMLWKTNFLKLYKDCFSDLKLIKERKFPYLNSKNIDVMFLLEKNGNKKS